MEESGKSKRAEAGRANWDRERALITSGRRKPHNVVHGANSAHFRRRYSDGRTLEGKRLKSLMARIVNDIRGEDGLTVEQELRLGTIRTSLIVLFQIGKYIDQQPELITNGDLIPVLRNSYLRYSNSLREQLDGLYRTRPVEAPDLNGYLDAQYGRKGGRK
jgi:hypothetical protein